MARSVLTADCNSSLFSQYVSGDSVKTKLEIQFTYGNQSFLLFGRAFSSSDKPFLISITLVNNTVNVIQDALGNFITFNPIIDGSSLTITLGRYMLSEILSDHAFSASIVS